MKHILPIAAAALCSSLLTAALGLAYFTFGVLQPLQKEAVDRGLASWNVVNNATGKTEFAWNEIDQTVHKANPDIFEQVAEPLPTK